MVERPATEKRFRDKGETAMKRSTKGIIGWTAVGVVAMVAGFAGALAGSAKPAR